MLKLVLIMIRTRYVGSGIELKPPLLRCVSGAFFLNGRLMIVQSKKYPDWTLPGGKIDPGETKIQALLRELQEELSCVSIIEKWIGDYRGNNPQNYTPIFVSVALVKIFGVPNLTENIIACDFLGRNDFAKIDTLSPVSKLIVEDIFHHNLA